MKTDPTHCPCCNARLPESGVSFDLGTGDLVVNGDRRHVEPQAALVLGMLAKHPGRAISRAQLLDAFTFNRPDCDVPSVKLVDVYLSLLRKALKGGDARIETCWNGTYRLCGGTIALIDTSMSDDDAWASMGIPNAESVSLAG